MMQPLGVMASAPCQLMVKQQHRNRVQSTLISPEQGRCRWTVLGHVHRWHLVLCLAPVTFSTTKTGSKLNNTQLIYTR